MNILLVEDDKIINEGVSEFLSESGYTISSVFNAEDALVKLNTQKINLVILDIMLPGMSGIEFLEIVKKEKNIPVIMLSAVDDEFTQVRLFDKLCDDYITKPFSLILLKKRIEAVLRLYYGDRDIWEYKNITIDFTSFSATKNGILIDVTPKEIKVFLMLLENEGKVITRAQILDNIWDNSDQEPFERVIDVYIKNLRKKLDIDCIYTIKGVGYKLDTKGK